MDRHNKSQSPPRVSYQGLLVLRAFLDRPRKELCGADLIKVTGLASGTLYPLLLRFENHDLLGSYWEDAEPEVVGRPRRRLYKLTGHGAKVARQLLTSVNQPSTPVIHSPAFNGG